MKLPSHTQDCYFIKSKPTSGGAIPIYRTTPYPISAVRFVFRTLYFEALDHIDPKDLGLGHCLEDIPPEGLVPVEYIGSRQKDQAFLSASTCRRHTP